MFDFSFPELLVVLVLAVVILGPEEIPKVMHGLGRIVRRLQYVRFALTQQFEDFMKENDLQGIRNSVNFEAKNFNEQEEDEQYLDKPQEELKSNDGSDNAKH